MPVNTPEDRELVLRDKAAREGFTVPQDVIDFLVERFDTEVRLKSELINIAMFAAHRSIPISLDVAKLVVDGERVRPLSTMTPEHERVTDSVTDATQVSNPDDPPTLFDLQQDTGVRSVSVLPTQKTPAQKTSTPADAASAPIPKSGADQTQSSSAPAEEEAPQTEAALRLASGSGSDVFFIPLRTQRKRSLLERINLALTRAGIDNMIQEDDKVAIKIHFGEEGNTGFVSPLHARNVVNRVKDLGGKPFLTDTNTLYAGQRQNAIDHINCAIANGFSYSAVGAPIIIADGLISRDSVVVPLEGTKHFESVRIASAAIDADVMIVISHVKGHSLAGFGGAIKNLGMGLGSRSAKQRIHSGIKPTVTASNCTACARCVDWCQPECITMEQGSTGARYAHIDHEHCTGCGECLTACAYGAIAINWDTSPQDFLERTVEHAAGALAHLGDKADTKVIYLNFLTNITPDCDCCSYSDAPIVPDIGILVSCDPVAIDQASVDLIEQAHGAQNSVGENLKRGEEKFEAMHDVDVALAMRYSEQLGLGIQNYRLRTVS